jgi:hypothetical protein
MTLSTIPEDYFEGYDPEPRRNAADADYAYGDLYSTDPRTLEDFRTHLKPTEQQRIGWKKARREAIEANRRKLGKDYIAPPGNPLLGYKYEDIEALTDLIGRRNVGVKFNPVWNSSIAAGEWLRQRRLNAKTADDQKKWAKYRIETEDRDHDPDTPDNVVLYSDWPNRRVKAVDGYSVISRNKKEALRARYDMYPDREERSAAMQSEKKKLKAYFRKFPSPTLWDKNPYENFEVPETVFNIIKAEIKPAFEMAGFTIYSPKKENGENGTLLVTQYMTLLQRITSWVMGAVYQALIVDIDDYDWVHDEYKLKTKARTADVRKDLDKPLEGTTMDRLTEYLNITLTPKENSTNKDYIVAVAVTYLFKQGKNVNTSNVLQFVRNLNAERGNKIRITNHNPLSNGIIHYTITNEELEEKKAGAPKMKILFHPPTSQRYGERQQVLGWLPPRRTGGPSIVDITDISELGGSSSSSSPKMTNAEFMKQQQDKRKKQQSKKPKPKKGSGFIADTGARTESRVEELEDEEA